jgi:hypothetical protein
LNFKSGYALFFVCGGFGYMFFWRQPFTFGGDIAFLVSMGNNSLRPYKLFGRFFIF